MNQHRPRRHLAPLFGYGRLSRLTLANEPLAAPRPAAGVLFRYTDAEGDWWLLGKRSATLGGTWANFGGSLLDPTEAPLAGAIRELSEETGLGVDVLAGAAVVAELQTGTPAVPYTLFVITLPGHVEAPTLNHEHDDIAWWHGEDVHTLNLHRGLAAAWATIRPAAPALATA